MSTLINYAKAVTTVTMVGYPDGPYPMARGNCFSVETEYGPRRVVNFCYENLAHLEAHGLKWPIKLASLNDRVAIIDDERIPENYYQMRYCSVCCPKSLRPEPQRMAAERDERRGWTKRLEGGMVCKIYSPEDRKKAFPGLIEP